MATKNTKWPSYNEIAITKFYIHVFIFYAIVVKESDEIIIVVLK